ncbi:GDYXXLXY domain-containing protein [Paenibacillus methanolicus]|uniref:Putative membrane-anchored protein n=1 Tax=Paenibacillus methanolicus TaxID=582686 RepID=A0A5S5BU54_9BACL|nr:GDYXXLXY domain-containing protein [Paenibacillus methanolicus]TYP70539.1 putative membrane-anchored protein [Paenibacillus methanolicus]
MQKTYVIRTGYALGAAMIAAAAIYFFASGWGAFGRATRIALSVLLTAALYGASYALWRRPRTAWLGRIAAVTGCVAFGVSVVLLGRIYNSHADSYGLFLMWSVPTLLFAWFAGYWPFKLLAYALLHLAFYAYVDAAGWRSPDETLDFIVGALVAAANLALFLLLAKYRGEEKLLRTLAFLMTGFQLVYLSNSLSFDSAGLLMNAGFVVWVAAVTRSALRHRRDGKQLLAMAGLHAACFLILKYIELVVHYPNVLFFALGVAFVIGLLAASAVFIRFLNRLDADEPGAYGEEGLQREHELAQPADAPTSAGAGRKRASRRTVAALDIQRVLWAVVSGVGVVIGAACIVGLTVLAAEDATPEALAVISVLLLLAAAFAMKAVPAPIRFTVLMTAVLLGLVTAAWAGKPMYALLYVALSLIAWALTKGIAKPLLFYALANVYAFWLMDAALPDSLRGGWNQLAALFAVNALAWAAGSLVRDADRKRSLRYAAYLALLTLGLLLTWEEAGQMTRFIAASLIYFGALTALLLTQAHGANRFYYRWGAAAWAVFLAVKYYDTAWKLLHKSFSLALAGVLAIALTALYDRRFGSREAAEAPSVTSLGAKAFVSILLLQGLLLGGTITVNETALAGGTTVKLELAPLDPRSLLQGDYVELNYGISTPPDRAASAFEQLEYGAKIKVVLAPDASGVYRFNRLHHSGEKLGAGEVALNGRWEGFRIEYGIEHFFIPEGTGGEVERTAKFAEVVVGLSGNGMIVGLLPR